MSREQPEKPRAAPESGPSDVLCFCLSNIASHWPLVCTHTTAHAHGHSHGFGCNKRRSGIKVFHSKMEYYTGRGWASNAVNILSQYGFAFSSVLNAASEHCSPLTDGSVMWRPRLPTRFRPCANQTNMLFGIRAGSAEKSGCAQTHPPKCLEAGEAYFNGVAGSTFVPSIRTASSASGSIPSA